jgi:hypothetical protein
MTIKQTLALAEKLRKTLNKKRAMRKLLEMHHVHSGGFHRSMREGLLLYLILHCHKDLIETWAHDDWMEAEGFEDYRQFFEGLSPRDKRIIENDLNNNSTVMPEKWMMKANG